MNQEILKVQIIGGGYNHEYFADRNLTLGEFKKVASHLTFTPLEETLIFHHGIMLQDEGLSLTALGVNFEDALHIVKVRYVFYFIISIT